jgi:hypothetical protein
VTGGALLGYHYYNKKNEIPPPKVTDEDIEKHLVEQAKNYGKGEQKYKGIYLLNKDTNKLYLRSNDGNIYRAGNISDCPFLLDDSNTVTAYEIGDIFNTFNCKNLPDQYKEKYKTQCFGSEGDISVLITSKEDFEAQLEKNAVGDITPSPDVCYDPNSLKGSSSLVNQPFGLVIYNNINDFIKNNKEKVGEFLQELGIFITVSKISIFFAVGLLVAPGIFTEDGWGSLKSGLMTSQMMGHWVVEKLEQACETAIVRNSDKAAIEAAEGSITKVSEKIAISTAKEMSTVMLEFGVKMLSRIGSLLNIIGAVQMLGMVIDLFDFCNLNNKNANLTQNLLDDVKYVMDYQFNSAIGIDMVNRNFNPEFLYCNYDIDPRRCSTKFKNCNNQAFIKGQKWGDGTINLLSEGNKTQISSEEYCSDVNAKFDYYVNEYINKLKVNSVGQCISRPTNEDWANVLKIYFPQYDWDPLSKIDKNNYPIDLYPKTDTARMFSILLVNENTMVAQFIKNNYYYFLSFFIVVLMIILLL